MPAETYINIDWLYGFMAGVVSTGLLAGALWSVSMSLPYEIKKPKHLKVYTPDYEDDI